MFAYLLVRHPTDIGGEVAQQPLFHVRMQLGFELVPTGVVAANNQLLEEPLLESSAQVLGHALEVVQRLVVDAALGMAAVVSGVTIAAALTSRRRAEHPFTLFQFIQPEIEEASLLAIHQHHPKMGLCAQEQGQRLQMELAVHEKLSSRQLRSQ